MPDGPDLVPVEKVLVEGGVSRELLVQEGLAHFN